MRNKLALILIFLFYNSFVNGQILTKMDSLHDYCAVCSNHQHLIIKPPYTKTFKKELPFLLTSAITFGGGFAVEGADKVKSYTREQIINGTPDRNSLNGFDRSSASNWSPSIAKTSDYVLLTASLLPALFVSEHHTDRDIKTLLVMYAEVFTLDYGLVNIAKYASNHEWSVSIIRCIFCESGFV